MLRKVVEDRDETPIARQSLAGLWDCGMDAKSINKRRGNRASLEAYLVLVAVAETTINHHDVHAACTTLPERPLRVSHGPHAQDQGGRL